jgi:hypothetical protein
MCIHIIRIKIDEKNAQQIRLFKKDKAHIYKHK